jgi:hypothetical protein
MDAIPGAPSIGHWTAKKPFYFFEVFRAYREYFPKSLLTSLYWMSVFIVFMSNGLLHILGFNPLWLQVVTTLAGLAILAVRFTSSHHEPMFQ